MNVLLVGYYGVGNFGDDLLLKVSHALVKRYFENSNISVLCHNLDENYIASFLNESVKIINPGDRVHYDLIVHGGGGTFHDYRQYGPIDWLINVGIRMLGFRRYAALDRAFRALVRKQRISGGRRIGFGIGVGSYTSSSRRLRHAIPSLVDFKKLVVRDLSSLENLKNLDARIPATLGSDLAFLDQYWIPESCKVSYRNSLSDRPKLGIVVRDWLEGDGNSYLNSIREIIPNLMHLFDISVFIFCREEDPISLSISWGAPVHVWNPYTEDFGEYCRLLFENDVVVTSRAHGALCAAVLGIPSLIINVEPKLETIHTMLPRSTMIVGTSRDELGRILALIWELLKIDRNLIAEDVRRNTSLICSAIGWDPI